MLYDKFIGLHTSNFKIMLANTFCPVTLTHNEMSLRSIK